MPIKSEATSVPENHLLVEQIRLLLGNVGSSVIPAILLSLVMVWALDNGHNTQPLMLWCAGVILSKLYSFMDARHWLARGIAPEKAPKLVWWLIIVHIIDGIAWSALAWVALESHSSAIDSILIISVLAGISGSSMALLSPVLPVFVAFGSAMLLVLGSRFWALDAGGYTALGLASVLYAASVFGQARNSAIATRNAIILRFENLSLIQRLNAEKQSAQDARKEAEDANQAKSRFLAAASHDLRQPIHAQGLFLELLARSELNEQQRDILQKARATSDATGDMLNTLLDFSRIEAGVVEPQLYGFALQPLLNKLEAELAPQADQKDLVYRSRETRVIAQSDPRLVALILRNFISNAIRYTEKGGVLVTCRQQGNSALVEVWDTGIGIEAAHQKDIFREFHQLGNPERDRNKGLGLGLAIADGLAQLLQHPLTLSSRPGRGSVFRLILPLAQSNEYVGDDEVAVANPFATASLKALRILLVDDDEAVRIGMQHLLQDWGCVCDTAEGLEEARLFARLHRPDIIISDYRLRGKSTGAEVIAELRAELGHDIPALLITGDTAPERLREALASGIPLLHKPVAPAQLQQALLLMRRSNPELAARSTS